MLESYLRPYYQRNFVDPIALRLAKIFPSSANGWTLLGCIAGFSVLPALITKQMYLAICLLLISGYLDTLDGTVARLSGNNSTRGSVFDIFADRLVEFSVVLALFLIDQQHRGLWCILMLGSMLMCITAFLVVGIFTPKEGEKSFYYSPGLMERAEAFIFFIAMMLLPSYFTQLAMMFVTLVFFTAIFHLFQFYKQSASIIVPQQT